MLIDPLRMAIAVLPIAVYFGLIGILNLRRRPFVTTGGCDLAALGAALTGMVLIGPVELFRPEATSPELGRFVWLFLLVPYWLSVWLAVLLSRPSIVVYNVSMEELRPVLAEAAREVDSQARWAGDSLALPTLDVQLHVEVFDAMRHISLKSNGGQQNLNGWRLLGAQLYDKLEDLPVRPNPRSVGILGTAAVLIALSVSRLLADPLEVAQVFDQMFYF